jgi:serine protease AprX
MVFEVRKVELARPLLSRKAMKVCAFPPTTRAKAVWGPRRVLTVLAVAVVAFGLTLDASAQSRHRESLRRVRPGTASARVNRDKMDNEVAKRASGFGLLGFATADVIVTLEGDADLPSTFLRYSHNGKLSVIHGYVLDQVPVWQLAALASSASTHRVHLNRPAGKHDALSSVAVNANAVDLGNGINNPSLYGYTGAGVTVAFIDSGITSYQHPDLADGRVLAFVDFVNGRTTRYDDNGHGTAVAGIIGGTGKLSSRKYAGMAPGASLVSLKVLDENGRGSVGDILKALDWVYTNGAAYGVRVVNLSVGAAVTESYYTDPLTLATKALVDRGVTVVAAAGNNGQNALGQSQWGGVVAPGNAPWVLTVCAFTTKGTYDVADDTVAAFSSAGPTAIDFSAKPDLCAPGVGVVSTAAPGSSLFQSGLLSPVSWLISGTVASTFPYVPYESLTGTSMATPMVSGAIALMLQANPSLTPNLIKGILEFTAISKPGVSPLRQGAGFMNVSHAVALAALAAHPTSTAVPMPTTWARHILWGNHLVSGGVLDPTANAWGLGVEWGWATTRADADNMADDGDNIVWGTADDGDNIVWGTDCGGADCDNIVWGTADGDNIVWGTADDGDNIVWGTADGDNIVWGTADDGDNIVWGTANVTNTVWPIFKGGK